MKTKSSKIGIYVSALLFLAMALGLAMPLQTARAASVVLVDNLQSSWTAPGGGGVFSAYIGPPDYGYVSPGTTAIYDGLEAGIIKAGFVGAVPAEGSEWDEGLFGFKPNVTINDFAAGALTYDVENQYGENPVWITIDIDTGVVGDRADDTSYQFVPTTNPAGWHTVNAAAGLWQKWNNYDGDVTGNPLISLSDVAAAHTGLNVVRAYLRLGMGASYHGTAGLGTVAWVDQATIAGVTYDFVVPTYWYVATTGADTNEGTAASPFLTIQHAIGAASPSDTINVAAGTYTEQVNITKSLTLSGAGMTNTHIESPTPTSMTIYDAFGSKSPTNRYIGHRGTNIPVVRIAASNVVFEGFHVNLNNYVFWDVLGSYPADTTYSRGVGILVDHVETVLGTPDVFTGIAIQNNKVDGLLSGDKGDGIKVLGNATATVTGNYLYGGESGINVQAVDGPVRGQYYPTVTANSNTIYSSGPSGGPFGIGFWSGATGSADGNTIYNDPVNDGYALNVWGSHPVSFTNNTVTNVGGVVGGLGAQLYESTDLIFANNTIEYQALAGAITYNPTATISGNTIINCTDGFVVDGQTSGAVTMHSNSFIGITASHYAVEVGGPAGGASGTYWGTWSNRGPSTVTVDASANWWGSTDPTTVAGKISGTVDFTPLLDSGTDTDLGAPGFQPSLSSLTVHTLGSQTGSTGRIQEGINLVSGSTVNVAAGTYVEVGQIVISKNLSIVGEAKATTIIQPAQDTGNSGNPRGWFLVQSGFTFNLSNVTLDGNGHKIYQGIRDLGSGTINNVIFTDIQYEASGPAYMGNAVAAMGGTGANVNITNSSFDNIGRIGVIFYGTGQTGTFDNNVYTGKGPGNWLDYGVEVGGGAHATITNNTISGNRGVASSDGSTSAGILVTTYYGSGSQAIITGNTLTDNTTGIAVGFDASDTSVVTAHNNAIYNNSEAGIDTTSSTIVVDATSNWWGAASGPLDNKKLPGTPNYNNPSGTGNKVSPYVDYSPWCVNETCSGNPPPPPSNFYGYIHYYVTPPLVGDKVDAYLPGVSGIAASATIILDTDTGFLAYQIDVTGDVDGTPAKEGGVDNDLITFQIGTRVVATARWHSGTNVRLDFHPPEAVPGGPYSGNEGSAIAFSGLANDWGTDATTYQWDWNNDGTYDETIQNTSHTWPDNGTYTVGLKVTDAQGGAGTKTFDVTVNNAAPVLDPIGNKSTDELVELAFTATGSDYDDPITFSLVGEPTGSAITSGGAFTWIPTEAQGPGSYPFTVKVCDNGSPVRCDEEAITVTVNEVNVAPVLGAIGPKTVDELVLLAFTATATDADLPTNILTFSLVGEPTGAAITTGGAFTWLPTEAQGPGSYPFTVKVCDNGSSALCDEELITVTVNEVNVAPVLGAIGNKNVDELVQLAFTATATDADVPTNILTFSLVGEPTGAAITAGGDFTWIPTEAQGPGSYPFTVKVCDNGSPVRCDEELITVTVNEVTVTHSISLILGWNLVSFNAHPKDTSIATVLSDIAGKYDLVYAWDASGGHAGSGNWMKYAPSAPPYANTLGSLDEKMGFWVHVTTVSIMNVVGDAPTTTNITLSTAAGGWNLVGYPSSVNHSLPAAMVDHGVGITDFSLVYAYHAIDTADPWKLYDPTAPAYANDLTELAPGWGYWVKVSAGKTWDVTY